MVKINGTLYLNTGYVRIKPNINFIGAKLGISVYDLSQPLEMELNPTPVEGLYLVDYCSDINSGFNPIEHWIIPNYNCTFDEVRGITKISLAYVKNLEDQIATLKAEKDKHLKLVENQRELINNRSSIDILNRFTW